MPPGLMRGLGVGLQEGLADRGGDHGVLALGHVRQGVALGASNARGSAAKLRRARG